MAVFNKQHDILLKIQQSKVHCFTLNFQQFTPRATSWTWDFPQKICIEMYEVKILCLCLSFLWCHLSNLDPMVNHFIFSLDSIIYILTSSPFQNSAKFQPRVSLTICCMLLHRYQNAEKISQPHQLSWQQIYASQYHMRLSALLGIPLTWPWNIPLIFSPVAYPNLY